VLVQDRRRDEGQGERLLFSPSPDIYIALKWSIDRFLVKVDDLKKK
jgi:hypothetical protein